MENSTSPFVIGVTGGSGSGKTFFLRKLKERFVPEQVCFVSQDNYYRPRHEQDTDDQGIRNFDRPQSIDKKAFHDDLKELLAYREVERLEYVYNNEHKKPRELIMRPAPIIVVEGIFVFHFKKIRKLIDLKVFVHAKENLKVIRRIKRDRAERNYPLEDVLYRYENHVLPTFEKYIKPYMDQADLVVNNNHHFEMGLDVLSGYMKHRLAEIGAGQD